MNQYINKFLNKSFMKKHFIFMVPKRELTFVLPYLGKILLDLRTRLRETIERDLPCCKLIVIFRSKCTLSILLQFKDSLENKFALE